MSRAIAVLLACVPVGVLLWLLAPRDWGVQPFDGLFAGAALYASALRTYLERIEARGGMDRSSRTVTVGLAWRAAFFLAVLVGLAWIAFEGLPGADLRRPFTVLSAWVVVQSLVDPGSWRAPRS